jgi:tetratricopeptide (TPR) repeat protein
MRSLNLMVVATLLLALSEARAEDKESRERAARKACLTGDATKGTEILADLYIDTRNPVYIYNQGRCFEQSNRYDEAIARFREYLRTATSATEEERLDAGKHIADSEALLARMRAAEVATQAGSPAPAPAVPNEPPPSPVAAQLEPVVVATQAPSAKPSPAGGGLRTAGVVTAAVGGAALIAGVVMNIKVNSTIDDLHRHYDKNTESSGKTYKTLSQVGYGVGAALVAGGALLYYLGMRARDGASVALLPSIAPGLAGVNLEGAF